MYKSNKIYVRSIFKELENVDEINFKNLNK